MHMFLFKPTCEEAGVIEILRRQERDANKKKPLERDKNPPILLGSVLKVVTEGTSKYDK